jgi:hypothetical protein
MTIRVTHTKTYTLMDAWAQCIADDDGATCAVDAKDIPAGEVYYYVTQLDRDENGNEQPVCWRHVRPNEGPLS